MFFVITVQGVLYIQMQNIVDASRERKLDTIIEPFNTKSWVYWNDANKWEIKLITTDHSSLKVNGIFNPHWNIIASGEAFHLPSAKHIGAYCWHTAEQLYKHLNLSIRNYFPIIFNIYIFKIHLIFLKIQCFPKRKVYW